MAINMSNSLRDEDKFSLKNKKLWKENIKINKNIK